MNIPLLEVWTRSPKRSNRSRILAFDPGETTGMFQLMRSPTPSFTSVSIQLKTPTLDEGYKAVEHQISQFNPDVVVCEDYRVYGHKVQQHSWAALHTPKFVGIITAVCLSRNIPIIMQMAGQAKGFCTDDKLRFWNMYNTNHRHANDAARHALFYLIFGSKHERTS